MSVQDERILREKGPEDLTDDEVADLAMLLDYWRDAPAILLAQAYRLGRERAFVSRGAKPIGSKAIE